jgi:hypothetical protein
VQQIKSILDLKSLRKRLVIRHTRHNIPTIQNTRQSPVILISRILRQKVRIQMKRPLVKIPRRRNKPEFIVEWRIKTRFQVHSGT